MSGFTLIVRRATVEAPGPVTDVRKAGQRGSRDDTLPRLIAGRWRRVGVADAGLARADSPRSVARTASVAIAPAARSARLRAAVDANAVRVRAVDRNGAAVTWRAREVAGVASAAAGAVAAEAVHAMVRTALTGTLTALSESLEPTPAVQAVVSGRTVVIGLAAPGAGSVDTSERAAIEDASRAACSGTIATPRGASERLPAQEGARHCVSGA